MSCHVLDCLSWGPKQGCKEAIVHKVVPLHDARPRATTPDFPPSVLAGSASRRGSHFGGHQRHPASTLPVFDRERQEARPHSAIAFCWTSGAATLQHRLCSCQKGASPASRWQQYPMLRVPTLSYSVHRIHVGGWSSPSLVTRFFGALRAQPTTPKTVQPLGYVSR